MRRLRTLVSVRSDSLQSCWPCTQLLPFTPSSALGTQKQTCRKGEAETVCVWVLQHLELRVKAAVARKNESIQQLQQQLAAAIEALRRTEAVLAAQQDELCD